MTKLKTLLLLTIFAAGTAHADTCSAKLVPTFTAQQASQMCATFVGTSTLSANLVPGTDNAYSLGTTAARFTEVNAKAVRFGPATVPTMAATPVVSANSFLPGLNVIGAASASTAAILGASSTPTVGDHFIISNASGQTVRIKAAGAATLNGATAGGFITIPNLATVECFTQAVGNQVCLQPVIPTPQGP